MARLKRIAAGALNIRLFPHSTGRYRGFLEKIFKLKQHAKLRGDRYGIISYIDFTEEESDTISGVITTFTSIDLDGKWFNTEALEEATPEQIMEVKIPENLRPNSHRFLFIFDISRHMLFFQTSASGGALSPRLAMALFERLSSDFSILEEFGEAHINIVQDNQALEKIFSLQVIREITISISKPNPDIFEITFERDIEAHLTEVGSKKMSITYKAESGSSIKPNDQIKRISRAALENGEVTATGRDASGTITVSTTDHPMQYQGKYDSEAETEKQAFRNILPRTKQKT